MPDVTLITPTGARPEAFVLCERWMARQTFQGAIQWVVVDDGAEPTPTTMGQTVLRPTPPWRPGQVTLRRNMASAIPMVEADKILIIEDDDYYAPGYVAMMVERLETAALVGETNTHYYHLGKRQYLNCGNRGHGSLFQTGLRREVLPKLEMLCRQASLFLDLGLFSGISNRKIFSSSKMSLGVKGMPGRKGIGMGHRPGNNFNPDPELEMLRSWIEDDLEAYRPWLGT